MSNPCYCIVLRRASRRLTAIYDAALAPLGVNLAQFSLLRTIQRTEPVSLTRLGHETELDRSTVGRNVRVLERRGLVSVDAVGHRESMVTLCGPGKRLLAEGAPMWSGAQTEVETVLGRDDTLQLVGLLRALAFEDSGETADGKASA